MYLLVHQKLKKLQLENPKSGYSSSVPGQNHLSLLMSGNNSACSSLPPTSICSSLGHRFLYQNPHQRRLKRNRKLRNLVIPPKRTRRWKRSPRTCLMSTSLLLRTQSSDYDTLVHLSNVTVFLLTQSHTPRSSLSQECKPITPMYTPNFSIH